MTFPLASDQPADAPPALPVPWPTRPRLDCAWGEVFDKLTILRLKQARLADPVRRDNVDRELAVVEEVVGDMRQFPPALDDAVSELAEVNATLWDIEDGTRACERAGTFDAAFVVLARSVYRENDRRARIKARIDRLLGSEIVAAKSHATAG